MSTDTKSKFKKGDRVRFTSAPPHTPEILGQTGTIDEDESTVPFVITDEGERLAMWAHKMELITAEPEQPAATDLDQQPAESPATFKPSLPLSPALEATEEPTRSFTKPALTAEARAFVERHFPTDSHGKGHYYRQLGVFAEFIESVFP